MTSNLSHQSPRLRANQHRFDGFAQEPWPSHCCRKRRRRTCSLSTWKHFQQLERSRAIHREMCHATTAGNFNRSPPLTNQAPSNAINVRKNSYPVESLCADRPETGRCRHRQLAFSHQPTFASPDIPGATTTMFRKTIETIAFSPFFVASRLARGRTRSSYIFIQELRRWYILHHGTTTIASEQKSHTKYQRYERSERHQPSAFEP